MMPLTRQDIIEVVGPLDEDLIVRIIDSGATYADVTEAHGWFVDSRSMGKARHHRPAGKVTEVCNILEEGWTPHDAE